jgi:hypothetical protein
MSFGQTWTGFEQPSNRGGIFLVPFSSYQPFALIFHLYQNLPNLIFQALFGQ